MVYGVLRLINFAHGDVYMLGAFAGYFLANALQLDENPSVPGMVAVTIGAMAICALVGILIERLAYRPVRHHSRLSSLIIIEPASSTHSQTTPCRSRTPK